MYVVCLLFYAIGRFLFVTMFVFSFPGVLGSTVAEKDGYFMLSQILLPLLIGEYLPV